jgi:hypothetical protein
MEGYAQIGVLSDNIGKNIQIAGNWDTSTPKIPRLSGTVVQGFV